MKLRKTKVTTVIPAAAANAEILQYALTDVHSAMEKSGHHVVS